MSSLAIDIPSSLYKCTVVYLFEIRIRFLNTRIFVTLLTYCYRSEGHRLKEKLIQGSEEQFLDVEKFLLEHDVQRSLLAAIDKPIILESIDQDGKCYLHSMQLTEKVRTHIKGRLSLAENDARCVQSV